MPDGEHVVPLGRAAILREGSDCTIVAVAAMVPRAVEAAERLQDEHGISAEVIDLRTLVPLDVATILASVEKTSRLFTVEENPRLCGWGAEIASIVADEGFYSLDAPIVRITTPHVPLPSAAALEDAAIPNVERIVSTVQTPPRGGEVTTVGLVGTGRMGTAMARALRAAGSGRRRLQPDPGAGDDLRGRDRRDCRADGRRRRLARRRHADDGRRRCRGRGGLPRAGRPARRRPAGTVLVDLSTVTPDTIRSLEADARAAGAGILDSPVSGSVTLAQSGQLTLMVGGTAEDLEQARPALEPLAKTIVHVGPLGAGAAMKLAVNTVIFGLNEALAEGLVLAEAAGVDRAMAYDVIAASAVGAPYVGYKRAAFLEPDETPVAFALDLAAKDLRLIAQLADSVGTLRCRRYRRTIHSFARPPHRSVATGTSPRWRPTSVRRAYP